MGARKRAARRWLWPWMQRREALHDFREMITEAPGVKVEYHLSRRRYRIGERLRPCEGCCACKSKRLTPRLAKREGHESFAGSLNVARTYWICGLLIMREGVDYGPFHRTEKHRDGSGVLPANR